MREKGKIEQYREIYSSLLKKRLKQKGLCFPGDAERGAYVTFLKGLLREEKEKIKELHLAGAGGSEVVFRITAWTDAVLKELFDAAKEQSGKSGKDIPLALLAVGGYGRGELNPFSDLDVMFLTARKIDPLSRGVADFCLYLMWDLNLDIGYSIRTIPDCVRLAASDIQAKTSLIESRYLAGNREVYQSFLKESGRSILSRNVEGYLKTKIRDVNDRHKKFGGSLYMKEPHVKEGVGGLRDIHTAFWIAKVKYGVDSLSRLRDRGVVSEKEYDILRHSLEFLWKVRNHLHYLSGRHNDRLTMEMQEEMATFFRYKDFKHYLAVERFMRGYYLHTRNVRYFTTMLINRCSPPPAGRRFSVFSLRKKMVGDGFAIVGKRLCVPENRKHFFQESPFRLMEVFALSQRYEVPPADATKQKIISSLGLVTDEFRGSSRVRDLFLKILSGKTAVVSTLRQMHELRFLGKYIPEFGALTALVQHELYHAYTVDEHSLVALEHLDGLRGTPYPEENFYSELFREVERPEILYLSLLLHDIGKAIGAGHVNLGGKAVRTIMRRMGFPREDGRTVEFLVRNHLVLAHLSQRRDIHESGLIRQLARVIQDEERLRMLTLITYCDSRGVGPGLWNDWKDTLLKELFFKTREQLMTGEEKTSEIDGRAYLERIKDRIRKEGKKLFGEKETERILSTLPDPYLLSTAQSRVMRHFSMILQVEENGFAVEWTHPLSRGYTELDICAFDSNTPGFFSRIAGVLASKGINILGARIFTSRVGIVIDSIYIEPPDHEKRTEPAYWNQIAEAVRAVLQGIRQVEKMLTEKSPPAYLVKKKRRKITPRVLFDNTVSKHYSVIDVYAEDRIGLLYHITSSLASQGVHIHTAKVSTEKEQAIDAFYVTDIFGHKITDRAKQDRIKNSLISALSADESVKS